MRVPEAKRKRSDGSSFPSFHADSDQTRSRDGKLNNTYRACVHALANDNMPGFYRHLETVCQLFPGWKDNLYACLRNKKVTRAARKQLIQLDKIVRSLEFSEKFHQHKPEYYPEYGIWELCPEKTKNITAADATAGLSFVSNFLLMEELHEKHPEQRVQRLACAKAHLDWCRDLCLIDPDSFMEWFRSYIIVLERFHDPENRKGNEEFDLSIRQMVDKVHRFKAEILSCKSRDDFKTVCANLMTWAQENDYSFLAMLTIGFCMGKYHAEREKQNTIPDITYKDIDRLFCPAVWCLMGFRNTDQSHVQETTRYMGDFGIPVAHFCDQFQILLKTALPYIINASDKSFSEAVRKDFAEKCALVMSPSYQIALELVSKKEFRECINFLESEVTNKKYMECEKTALYLMLSHCLLAHGQKAKALVILAQLNTSGATMIHYQHLCLLEAAGEKDLARGLLPDRKDYEVNMQFPFQRMAKRLYKKTVEEKRKKNESEVKLEKPQEQDTVWARQRQSDWEQYRSMLIDEKNQHAQELQEVKRENKKMVDNLLETQKKLELDLQQMKKKFDDQRGKRRQADSEIFKLQRHVKELENKLREDAQEAKKLEELNTHYKVRLGIEKKSVQFFKKTNDNFSLEIIEERSELAQTRAKLESSKQLLDEQKRELAALKEMVECIRNEKIEVEKKLIL